MRASGIPQKNKVVGRCLPTPRGHTLPLHHLPIFAPNHAVTKFCFWYSVSLLKKTKSSGELLWCRPTHTCITISLLGCVTKM
uniref:Uncharacterized protein n=1 Tax=Neovison vison TaxID=452646 RepID=A0A8C7AM05_NEOVI